MNVPTICIVTLWLVWFGAWHLAAPFAAPPRVAQTAAGRLAHAAPSVLGAALLFAPAQWYGGLQRLLLPATFWLPWLGTVAVTLGLGFAAWARVHLGRFWSGPVTLKADHALIRTGPYGLTRHPIYTGLIVALSGTAVARGHIAAFVGLGCFLAGIALKIRQEEQLLVAHFGDAYRAYQGEVPALWPRPRRGQQPN